jgi:hypothetical protein
MADVRQCPYCELRFLLRNELDMHIALDHPDVARDDVDDDTVPPPAGGDDGSP